MCRFICCCCGCILFSTFLMPRINFLSARDLYLTDAREPELGAPPMTYSDLSSSSHPTSPFNNSPTQQKETTFLNPQLEKEVKMFRIVCPPCLIHTATQSPCTSIEKRANRQQTAQNPRHNNSLPQTLPPFLNTRPQPPPHCIRKCLGSRKRYSRPSQRDYTYTFGVWFMGSRRSLARRL